MSKIDYMANTQADEGYLRLAFKRVIEDHLTYLKNHEETKFVPVEPILVDRFDFDLIRIFNNLKIPPNLHWVVARMNNFDNYHNVPKDTAGFLVPDAKVISRLYQLNLSTNYID